MPDTISSKTTQKKTTNKKQIAEPRKLPGGSAKTEELHRGGIIINRIYRPDIEAQQRALQFALECAQGLHADKPTPEYSPSLPEKLPLSA